MSGGRLPSFRGPRDLSLNSLSSGARGVGARGRGGARGGLTVKPNLDADRKKKFVPNLNVARVKQEHGTASDKDSKPSAAGWKRPPNATGSRGRGGPDSRGGRGRGRGSNSEGSRAARPELIQTMGNVFGEGISDDIGIRRRSAGKRRPIDLSRISNSSIFFTFEGRGGGGGGGDRESSANMEKPKMNLNAKFDKAADEKKLKDLLRDDFVDDLKSGPLVPVQLPMIDTGKVFKEEQEESVKKKDADDEDSIKPAKGKKNVILDSDDDDSDNEGGKTVAKTLIKAESKPVPSAVPELAFTDLVKNQKGDLLFFQMPDHLPAQGPNIKSDPEPTPSSASATPLASAAATSKTVLSNLREGYLGKLQIRKSGKTQLLINDTLLDVDVGVQVGFLQELFSVETPKPQEEDVENGAAPVAPEAGHMTNLGRVKHRIVAAPAWQELFDATNSNTTESSSDEEDEHESSKMDTS